MKPIFVCQLPQEQQDKIEKMIRDMLVSGVVIGEADSNEPISNEHEEIIENCMNSKIVDLEYLIHYYAHEFVNDSSAEYQDITNAVAVSEILSNSRNYEVDDFKPTNTVIGDEEIDR